MSRTNWCPVPHAGTPSGKLTRRPPGPSDGCLSSRYGAASATVGELLAVYGGSCARGALSGEGACFARSAERWLPLPPLPSARHFHTVTAVSPSALVLFGGKSQRYHSDCWRLELEPVDPRQPGAVVGGRWTGLEASGSGPSARYGHSAVHYRDGLWIFGGYDAMGLACNDLYRLDLKRLGWERIDAIGQAPATYHHSAVVYQGSMYIFGGESSNSVSEYRFGTQTWSSATSIGYSPRLRVGHVATVWNDWMFIFGGYDPTSDDEGEMSRYHLSTGTWTRVEAPELAGSSRNFSCASLVGAAWLVFGGKRGDNTLFGDLLEYSFDDPTEPSPSTLRLHPPAFKDLECTFESDMLALLNSGIVDLKGVSPQESMEVLIGLQRVSHLLEMAELHRFCQEKLAARIDGLNLPSIYELAQEVGAVHLSEICRHFFVNNFQMLSGETKRALPKNLVRKWMKEQSTERILEERSGLMI